MSICKVKIILTKYIKSLPKHIPSIAIKTLLDECFCFLSFLQAVVKQLLN